MKIVPLIYDKGELYEFYELYWYVVLQQQINTCTGCVEFVINFKFSASAFMSQNQSNIQTKVVWCCYNEKNKKQLHQELNKLIPSQNAVQTAK